MTSRFRFGSAIALTALLVSTGAAMAQFNLRQTPGPQPGQCKVAPITVHAQNSAHAQALWSATTVQAHGQNWSIWVAAADRYLVPIGNLWRASGRPCFMPPVP